MSWYTEIRTEERERAVLILEAFWEANQSFTFKDFEKLSNLILKD